MRELPDDYECEGQMSIYDLFEDPLDLNPLIAVSKVFAKSIKQMNLKEWKTFVYALTQIKWTEQNKHFVRIDKKALANVIGIHSDPDHLSQDLRRAIGKLPVHSFIEIQNDNDWISGCFISQVACYKNIVRITFADAYMPLFEELNKERNYITMWAEDLFKMRSERSILFYEDLRLHSDTRATNSRIYSTRDLKQLFSIPKEGKGAYMKSNGHFNRTEFENKVIHPLCDDLENCAMIKLVRQADGKPFAKVKKHGYVVGYEFTWDCSTHPAVASATELKQIEQDPAVIKVAKDILKSNHASNKKYHHELERDYDFEQIEAELIGKRRK